MYAAYRERRGLSASSEYVEQKHALSRSKRQKISVKCKIAAKRRKLSTQKKSDGIEDVRICRDEVISGIVQLVTVNERPFALLEDEGFLRIVQPIYKAFDLQIDRHNIVDRLHDNCELIKAKLHQLVHGKLVNIKVDCATFTDRIFIGINVLFMHDDKIITFALNATEIDISSADDVPEIVLSELRRYEITPAQIYSVSTGNWACSLEEEVLHLDSVEEIDTKSHDNFDTQLSYNILHSNWKEFDITSNNFISDKTFC